MTNEKGMQKKWESIWNSELSKKASGSCLNLAFFANHIFSPSKSICDVGCGNISYLKQMSDILKGEFEIYNNPAGSFEYYVGVDFSGKALRMARDIARLTGIAEKTDFVKADLKSLPFRDRPFESVTCVETLQLLGKNYAEGLEEISRISGKELYLTMTRKQPKDKIVGNVDGGSLIKVKLNPYQLVAFDDEKFREVLSRYGSVEGSEVHPCPHELMCFPGRMLFKISK